MEQVTSINTNNYKECNNEGNNEVMMKKSVEWYNFYNDTMNIRICQAGLSPPSAAAASVPSAPSAASASAGFSGSFITVGAANVAITKSLPWMVGTTSCSSLIDEILKLSPISTPSRSITKLSGIFW